MTTEKTSHIEPSRHSTDQVDAFLDMVEDNIDAADGAGSPAIKPNTNLGDDGKPNTDTPKNPRV
jgi:hypothetical protein